MWRNFLLASCWCSLTISVAAFSAAPEQSAQRLGTLQALEPALDKLTTQGGQVQLFWNDDMLMALGIERIATSKTIFSTANLSDYSRLRLALDHAAVVGIFNGSGTLQINDTLKLNGRALDWRALKIVTRAGQEPRIDLIDAQGRLVLYVDRIMFKMLDDGKTFFIRSADLRVADNLAKRAGRPELADATVAEFKATAMTTNREFTAQPKACGAPNWPGNQVLDGGGVPIAGASYQADVFMANFTATASRCGVCNATETTCTAVSCTTGSPTHLVLTPSSTLANNRNRGNSLPTVSGDPAGTSSVTYAADVPWHDKYSGTFPPYGNDQHPFLVWNLYRIDTENGAERITQIGRSGVKHAFLTTNVSPFGASEPCESCNGNNVLGKSCGDTYGTGNNDSSPDLGPRSAIVAKSGVWGRQGALFANSSYDQRLRVPVTALTNVAGVRYLFESWYVVRDDVNIYNTMASRSVTFTGTAVSNSGSQGFVLGPAIDRWVSPTSVNPLERNRELNVSEGHAKVAVRVVDLGGGLYRYHFAVMNLDFSRATVGGTITDPSVTNNFGFNRFRVPTGVGAVISDVAYYDGDALRNDWTFASGSDFVEWSAGANADSLNWGAMTSFSFTANVAPTNSPAVLGVTNAGSPAEYAVQSLTPGGLPTLLVDGFEN
jgi:hypothetical protein